MPARRWTIRELLSTSSEYLKQKGIESPRLNAELLLSKTLNVSRLRLYLDLERPITSEELSQFRSLIRRRTKREPIQYILGTAGFYNLELKVGPGVLIPRPETELLVETILKEINSQGLGPEPIRCLDVGTGSGCIAISVLKECPNTHFVATDISQEALNCARENSMTFGLENRIDLRQGSLFEPIMEGERFHIIASNPPYVREDEWEGLQPEIRSYEPKEALLAGPDGLRVIRALILKSIDYLETGGFLILELAPSQAQEVASLMQKRGYQNVRLLRDLSGALRAAIGYLEPPERKS